MNLDEFATHDNLDEVTWTDIHRWAVHYLPPESAKAFADSMDTDLGEWGVDEDERENLATIRAVLIAGYWEWIGSDYPTP